MSDVEREVIGEKLVRSLRGAYLIGQALAIASAVLHDSGEKSNAEDMQIMGETLCKFGYREQRILAEHV